MFFCYNTNGSIKKNGADSLKKFLKIISWIIGVLLGIALCIFIAFEVSPRPGVFVIKKAFEGQDKVTEVKSYNENKEKVTKISDIAYKSEYKKNQLDIYYPKGTAEKLPVIFWVHGGGYVAGDKSGMEEFALRITSQAKVAVVSVNYELAPDLEYPGQVKQVDEMYRYLSKQKSKYPMLDFDHVFFGGDSAGSQIALQYAAIQTNSEYAKQMKMDQAVKPQHIIGTISYCGPVDLKQTANEHSDDRFLKFFVKTVAWSLIGEKDWKNSPQLLEASLVDHVTKDFPPTYITDGNAFSFQKQGIAFADKLKQLNVPVQTLFYDGENKVITHEYQFDYTTQEAETCYQQTVEFIQQQISRAT
ncbi:hydrolase, alpha/beta domain protein [Enterococcus faecalis 13-SD-W-01]|nr:hydrolase, alpha/beta domain protein [Enterococcus faecalis 13-SD-W-01]